MLPDEPPQGLVRRLITVLRHLIGLGFGALVAGVRSQVGAERSKRRSFRLALLLARLTAWLARPFLDKEIVDRPFPVQLRRRLEILGPTYIKLGQVLALRQDILPVEITEAPSRVVARWIWAIDAEPVGTGSTQEYISSIGRLRSATISSR